MEQQAAPAWTPARQALPPAPALVAAPADDPRWRRTAGEGLLSLAPFALPQPALGPPTRTPLVASAGGAGERPLAGLRPATGALGAVPFPATRAPTAYSRDWPGSGVWQRQDGQPPAGHGFAFGHAGTSAFENLAWRREVFQSPAAAMITPALSEQKRNGAPHNFQAGGGATAAASVAFPPTFIQQHAPQQQQFSAPLHAYNQSLNPPAYDAETLSAARLFMSLSSGPAEWCSPAYNQRPTDLFAPPPQNTQLTGLPFFTSPVELLATSRERKEHMEASLDVASRTAVGEDLLSSIAQQACGQQIDSSSTTLAEYDSPPSPTSPFDRLRTTTVPPTRAPIVVGSSLGFRHLSMADILNGSPGDSDVSPGKLSKKKRKYSRKTTTEPQLRRRTLKDEITTNSQVGLLSGRRVPTATIRLSNGFRPTFVEARITTARTKGTTPLRVPILKFPTMEKSNPPATKRSVPSPSLSSPSTSPLKKKNKPMRTEGTGSTIESIGTPDKTSIDAPSLDDDSVKTWSSDEASGTHRHHHHHHPKRNETGLDFSFAGLPACTNKEVASEDPDAIAIADPGSVVDQGQPPRTARKSQRNSRRSQPLTIAMKLATIKMNEAKRSIGVDVDVDGDDNANFTQDTSAEQVVEMPRPKTKDTSASSTLQDASSDANSYSFETSMSAPVIETEVSLIPEANTVVMFCRRDFMRYQAVKLWRKYQEQQQKQQWRAIKVEGKRTRYLNSKYESMLLKPKK